VGPDRHQRWGRGSEKDATGGVENWKDEVKPVKGCKAMQMRKSLEVVLDPGGCCMGTSRAGGKKNSWPIRLDPNYCLWREIRRWQKTLTGGQLRQVDETGEVSRARSEIWP